MKLSDKEVRHVATLAGLALSEIEVYRMVGEISEILDYVEALAAVEVPSEEASGESLPTLLAPDVAIPSLARDRALSNAPDRSGNFFQVPRILEEGR